MPDKTTIIELWTYVGIVVYTNQKHFAYETPSDGMASYKRAIFPSYAKPGAQYHVTVEVSPTENSSGRSVFFKGENSPKYSGVHPDEELVMSWGLRSEAAEVTLRMVKKSKNDMTESALAKILAPLKGEYQGMNRTGRAALMASIYLELNK